ncbi:uncharacterized protein MONOS_12942 [Monocercomonoides exilis]|uniref:uncharacterized protein n=1 Tax=Monocercomonoides exilis TaxID=2049356 RepID=UPI00355A635F|nr:hypothetical protein MONOS_12942 [Monocercomonoides exilis]|eukprot:MONOS_12942.1-p1 / transcript=MONOS_12942.1 / gene=MONOS_12942 / organism=Monocercomonoides_exilis_PA203 / gene_product=unspecified product / transcript_product=unspecified product / location=Mono_scaffold00757:1136-2383(+) / protein_length=416 / sequence_SO=supercontig / SO=protein_coding / is_pseudo=false
MEKDIFEPLNGHVPASILEFAAQLPKAQREKCHSLFSRSAPNLPMPTELDRFSESLDVLEKADFWKAVSQVRAQSTNLVPLPSLPTSDNICAYPAAPPNLEGVNSSVPVADEVRCDPPTNLGAAAPKNKWELSFVAPIIDEEGVPSRQFFSQLMKGEKAVKEPEKEKTPFLRSTDVQREVARKSIENESFQNDKCLDEDQKFVITEFKRVWGKEKKRVACNKRFCLGNLCFLLCSVYTLMAGYVLVMVGGLLMEDKDMPIGANIAMIVVGAIIAIVCTVLLICTCCPTGLSSLGVERDLASQGFWDDLRESMKPCVRQRVKNWRRKKEWRWLLSKDERRNEEKIDKVEDARKKKEENEKLSREAAIEMEKLQMKQVITAGTSGTGNVEFSNQAYSASVAVEVEPRTILKEEEYHY